MTYARERLQGARPLEVRSAGGAMKLRCKAEGNTDVRKPCRSSRGWTGITRKRGKVVGDTASSVGARTCPRMALMRSGSETDPAMGQYVGVVRRRRIEKPTTPWSLRAVPPERRYARGKGGARSRDHAGERGQGAGARGQGALGRRPPANRGLPAVPHAEKRGALGYRYLLAEAMARLFRGARKRGHPKSQIADHCTQSAPLLARGRVLLVAMRYEVE